MFTKFAATICGQMTVEIYTESGHHKGTYSVWLSKGDKYIKFNDEWIRIEGKSRKHSIKYDCQFD